MSAFNLVIGLASVQHIPGDQGARTALRLAEVFLIEDLRQPRPGAALGDKLLTGHGNTSALIYFFPPAPYLPHQADSPDERTIPPDWAWASSTNDWKRVSVPLQEDQTPNENPQVVRPEAAAQRADGAG